MRNHRWSNESNENLDSAAGPTTPPFKRFLQLATGWTAMWRSGRILAAVGAISAMAPALGVPLSPPSSHVTSAAPVIVSLTYPSGPLAATGGVADVEAQVSGASTCSLSADSATSTPIYVSVSPTTVACSNGEAQFSVTYGSSLDPDGAAISLTFSAGAASTSAPTASRSLSLVVAPGPATGPAIPPVGRSYLGAFVNPSGVGKNEPAEAKALFSAIDVKGLGILHWYVGFNYPAAEAVSGIGELAKLGAIPLLDWAGSSSCAPVNAGGCEQWISTLANGGDNSTISSMAEALKGYGKPVLLRFFWEMNLHLPTSLGRTFVQAWDNVVKVFSEDDVSNVAFVWCPGISGGLDTFMPFYPGASEVDWIGADGYDGGAHGSAGFDDLFRSWYEKWNGENRPMIVAETAARMGGVPEGAPNCIDGTDPTVDEQAQYIDGIGTALEATNPTETIPYPDLKALVYFDSSGTNGPWCLDQYPNGGEVAFGTLAHGPRFSFMPPNG